MCRLYGFNSTAPRKVECELIESQNSLIVQSRRDERGKSNPDGWGLVTYHDGVPRVERQTEPAYSSEDFRWAAAKAYSKIVVAHVRRATVGHVRSENTHPFVDGRHTLVHNGTIGAFSLIRDRMVREMGETASKRIRGSTDSEHFFYLLLAKAEGNGLPLGSALAQCCDMVAGWAAEADPSAEFALNVIWTDGSAMAGSRLGRSLWYTLRDDVHVCEVCGSKHAIVLDDQPYAAVVVASERITGNEEWSSVGDGSVFEITSDCSLVTTWM